jgi:hypothetical protein
MKRISRGQDQGPVTLAEAKAMVGKEPAVGSRAAGAKRRAAVRGDAELPEAASAASVGRERKKFARERQRELAERADAYAAVMSLMVSRGVQGLPDDVVGEGEQKGRGRRRAAATRATASGPLRIFAEGDSWFDYPPFMLKGGIIPRLEQRLGVPILNLAKAGDEVRYMLGVEQRRLLAKHFREGCPAGGPWDVLLFSGGGNDIVDNPMALWVRDYAAGRTAADLVHKERFAAALALVRAGYEDLVAMRNALSPSTQLILHAYDFAIPDGRGVCHLGPWMKPTFDVRGFPEGSPRRFEVVKVMLQQFAGMLQSLAVSHAKVTFINAQGTLAASPAAWHNELHPGRDGFDKFAAVFHGNIRSLFPGRVL